MQSDSLGVYDLYVVDPPWPQQKGGLRAVRPQQGRSLAYNTMEVSGIFDLLRTEIFPRGHKHTVFMWTIDKYLTQCEQNMEEDGYRLHARLVWDKMNGVAPAFSVRFSHEYLLWYYKPTFTPVHPDARGKYTTVFREVPREHSRKPNVAYHTLEQMFPDARKLDVFSREPRAGWDQYGDQLDFFSLNG